MKNILIRYVNEFNTRDNEYYVQDIANAKAGEWMFENIPLIDIPDKVIEEIYYFRWWVFRKHIKNTEDGYVITEFLPRVPWSGKHNTIIAAAGHHITEAKWLKCGREIIEDYSRLWLDEKSKTYLYSSWIIDSIYEYCRHIGDYSFGTQNLNSLIRYYENFEREHITKCGLLWSLDNHDAMEYSISGVSEDGRVMKGLRPTLNSYMAANALAISKLSAISNEQEISKLYLEKHEFLKNKMNELLWDGEFYKAIHKDNLNEPTFDNLPVTQNVKELIGYIPWQFNLAPEGYESAFKELKKADGFLSPHGLCTAERKHVRYLYQADHECLWNGYIWPFATSQTLRAIENLLTNYKQDIITESDFYNLIRQYAESHKITLPDGKSLCMIDEVKHPDTNEWSSRIILKNAGWQEQKGGFERGKDYNHSTFCDIVLGGLLGIRPENGEVSVNPRIPESWTYFKVDNLYIGDHIYSITYDKSGEKYKSGVGLTIAKTERVPRQ